MSDISRRGFIRISGGVTSVIGLAGCTGGDNDSTESTSPSGDEVTTALESTSTNGDARQSVGGDWTMRNHDAGRTSFASEEHGITEELATAWTWSPEGTISGSVTRSAPAVKDGVAFFAENGVYAIDATGETKWSASFEAETEIAVLGDTIRFFGDDGKLVTLDIETGDRMNVVDVFESTPEYPVFAEGHVFGYLDGTADNTLAAADYESGETKWQNKFDNYAGYGPRLTAGPVVMDGSVFVPEGAFDAATGDAQWRAEDLELPARIRTLVASDGTLYGSGTTYNSEADTDEFWTYALNPADGSVTWKAKLDSEQGFVRAVDDESVYFASDARLVARNKDDGTEQWTFTTASDAPISSVVATTNVVYFLQGANSRSPKIRAVDRNGEQLSSVSKEIATEMVAANDMVYVSGQGLYGIKPSSELDTTTDV